MKYWNQLSVICSGNVSIRKQFTFNGTRYSVTGKTESEVERKIQSKKQALERENEPTVSQWVDTFLDVYKVNVSDKTRYDYSLVLNHVRSDSKLSDIKPIDLQRMFNLHKDKSKSFIHKLKILTHELFETARSNGYIKNNPMDAVNVPKGYTNHRRALTEEERRNVMELCKTDKRRNFILLMLQCGLRPSETTYIQGKDINKSDRLLHVRGTKTEAADRFIPIPEPLFSMIKDYSGDRYVICTKPLISSLESYWKWFKRAYEKRFGKCEFTPYCFRHTYITDLCSAGVPLAEARFLAGHSDISMTAEIYTHQSERALSNAKQLIDNFNQKLSE